MHQRNWKFWAFILNIFGCSQFIILTSIAMFYYGGGTYADPFTQGYIFWYNYFSDLGRISAHSGNPNIISSLLFMITLNLWGIFQIPFYVALPSFFKKTRRIKFISIISSLFGILTGIFFIGIAFTPSDILGFWHDFFVLLGFGSIFISISLFTIVLFQNKDYPKSYAIVCAITSGVLIIYYIALFFIPNNNISAVLFIYVTGQKVIIYTLLICEIYQAFGAIKQLLS
ncbi:MAG: hypothetical protein ACFFA4_13935 [Promethearchaeota archaeon]